MAQVVPPGTKSTTVTSGVLYDSMVRTYQEVFDDLYIFDVRGAGNKILVALPRNERIDQDDLARRAKRISTDRHFPYDMADVVIYGYQYAGEKNSRGRVLTDEDEPE